VNVTALFVLVTVKPVGVAGTAEETAADGVMAAPSGELPLVFTGFTDCTT
jgi:hypothetical protein